MNYNVCIIAEHRESGWTLQVSAFKPDGAGESWQAHVLYDAETLGQIVTECLKLYGEGKSALDMVDAIPSRQ